MPSLPGKSLSHTEQNIQHPAPKEGADSSTIATLSAATLFATRTATSKAEQNAAKQIHNQSLGQVHRELTQLAELSRAHNHGNTIAAVTHSKTQTELAAATDAVAHLAQQLATEQILAAAERSVTRHSIKFQEHFRRVAEAEREAEERSELTSKAGAEKGAKQEPEKSPEPAARSGLITKCVFSGNTNNDNRPEFVRKARATSTQPDSTPEQPNKASIMLKVS